MSTPEIFATSRSSTVSTSGVQLSAAALESVEDLSPADRQEAVENMIADTPVRNGFVHLAVACSTLLWFFLAAQIGFIASEDTKIKQAYKDSDDLVFSYRSASVTDEAFEVAIEFKVLGMPMRMSPQGAMVLFIIYGLFGVAALVLWPLGYRPRAGTKLITPAYLKVLYFCMLFSSLLLPAFSLASVSLVARQALGEKTTFLCPAVDSVWQSAYGTADGSTAAAMTSGDLGNIYSKSYLTVKRDVGNTWTDVATAMSDSGRTKKSSPFTSWGSTTSVDGEVSSENDYGWFIDDKRKSVWDKVIAYFEALKEERSDSLNFLPMYTSGNYWGLEGDGSKNQMFVPEETSTDWGYSYYNPEGSFVDFVELIEITLPLELTPFSTTKHAMSLKIVSDTESRTSAPLSWNGEITNTAYSFDYIGSEERRVTSMYDFLRNGVDYNNEIPTTTPVLVSGDTCGGKSKTLARSAFMKADYRTNYNPRDAEGNDVEGGKMTARERFLTDLHMQVHHLITDPCDQRALHTVYVIFTLLTLILTIYMISEILQDDVYLTPTEERGCSLGILEAFPISN